MSLRGKRKLHSALRILPPTWQLDEHIPLVEGERRRVRLLERVERAVQHCRQLIAQTLHVLHIWFI